MNQVAHKVVPAVATNNRMVLKPSEKVPLSALLFADILYEAGLPGPMLSVITGDPKEIADEMQMPVDRVRAVLKMAQQPISLQSPVGDSDDTSFGWLPKHLRSFASTFFLVYTLS
jgi:hypothetical protein